jgi:hypothetical protein
MSGGAIRIFPFQSACSKPIWTGLFDALEPHHYVRFRRIQHSAAVGRNQTKGTASPSSRIGSVCQQRDASSMGYAVQEFLSKHADAVIGTPSGFDRPMFRGTLRLRAHSAGVIRYLWVAGVLLKDSAETLTRRLKEASESRA